MLCPNDTSPVYPTHKLRAVVAIARMTTVVAVFVDKPNARRTIGNASNATAANIANAGSFKFLDAFAEQPARAEQKHQKHQDINRCFTGGRRKMDCDTAHDANEDCGKHNTPKTA